MKKTYLQAAIVLVMILWAAPYAWSHCEIPCGIYDDQMRIHLIAEHIRTIEKSMQEVKRLAGKTPTNYKQLTRWIMNKEDHANQLQEVVTQYFMTQRIKLDAKDYTEKIGLLHKMLVYAMKCKQTTDLSHVKTLEGLVKDFSDLYFGKKMHHQ